MPLVTGNVISTAPAVSVQRNEEITLFMKCDTASSGQGLQTLEVPGFLQGYELPSGSVSLFLDAKTQRNLWGQNLTEIYPYYTDNWSAISSTGFISSGIVNNQLSISVSGSRIIDFYAVMPMSIYVDSTGASSSTMSLYTLNQEVATGELSLFTKGHQNPPESMISLSVVGGAPASSGTMALVATGVGYSFSTSSLYVFGIGSGVSLSD